MTTTVGRRLRCVLMLAAVSILAVAGIGGPSDATVRPRVAKGVDVWSFDGVASALLQSNATWYLTWSATHVGIPALRGVQFVPMVWGRASVTASTLAEARRSGPDLLTFNEPESASQADMTVSEALALWPRLEATGLQLGSPAVADDAATAGGWLDRFMIGAERRHDRVDFIAVHWYGSDFRPIGAVAELRAYLVSIERRYRRPIWLTEYTLINFGAEPEFPTGAEQAAFVTASVRMLDDLTFVRRFAWFALATSGARSTGLFRPGARPTSAGRAFEAAA